jgi:hypothetical protein
VSCWQHFHKKLFFILYCTDFSGLNTFKVDNFITKTKLSFEWKRQKNLGGTLQTEGKYLAWTKGKAATIL